jgi:hypothetical protein
LEISSSRASPCCDTREFGDFTSSDTPNQTIAQAFSRRPSRFSERPVEYSIEKLMGKVNRKSGISSISNLDIRANYIAE